MKYKASSHYNKENNTSKNNKNLPELSFFNNPAI